LGAVVAVRARGDRPILLPLAGAAAYLAYTMRIGGDYMSGRLFALPLLLSVVAIVYVVRDARVAVAIGVAAAVACALDPHPPLVSGGGYPALPPDPTGVRDERGEYYPTNGLLRLIEPGRGDPGYASAGVGHRLRDDPPQAVVWGAIGYHGFVYG